MHTRKGRTKVFWVYRQRQRETKKLLFSLPTISSSSQTPSKKRILNSQTTIDSVSPKSWGNNSTKVKNRDNLFMLAHSWTCQNSSRPNILCLLYDSWMSFQRIGSRFLLKDNRWIGTNLWEDWCPAIAVGQIYHPWKRVSSMMTLTLDTETISTTDLCISLRWKPLRSMQSKVLSLLLRNPKQTQSIDSDLWGFTVTEQQIRTQSPFQHIWEWEASKEWGTW